MSVFSMMYALKHQGQRQNYIVYVFRGRFQLQSTDKQPNKLMQRGGTGEIVLRPAQQKQLTCKQFNTGVFLLHRSSRYITPESSNKPVLILTPASWLFYHKQKIFLPSTTFNSCCPLLAARKHVYFLLLFNPKHPASLYSVLMNADMAVVQTKRRFTTFKVQQGIHKRILGRTST